LQIDTVTTSDRSLLASVRETLAGAEEALLCVAFVHSRGVHLIEKELRELARRGRSRMVVTTTFDHDGGSALAVAAACGVAVRTLNPGSGSTFHPKVYLGRGRSRVNAVVGSANLTGGLATNVEVAMFLRGSSDDKPLAALWQWAEQTWTDPRAFDWKASVAESPVDDPLQLREEIAAEVRRDPVFLTLGARPARNRVVDVDASGVYVETERSKQRGRSAEFIPAWMFNTAIDYLRAFGKLTNHELLDNLRVHRSSAVCAILSRLPGIRPMPGRVVGVQLGGASEDRVRRE